MQSFCYPHYFLLSDTTIMRRACKFVTIHQIQSFTVMCNMHHGCARLLQTENFADSDIWRFKSNLVVFKTPNPQQEGQIAGYLLLLHQVNHPPRPAPLSSLSSPQGIATSISSSLQNVHHCIPPSRASQHRCPLESHTNLSHCRCLSTHPPPCMYSLQH